MPSSILCLLVLLAVHCSVSLAFVVRFSTQKTRFPPSSSMLRFKEKEHRDDALAISAAAAAAATAKTQVIIPGQDLSERMIHPNHQSAMDALERLRDRQTRELLETERMLDALNAASQQEEKEENRFEKSASSHHHFSTAASILSGTDYGFVSRSEGPPSALQGGRTFLNPNSGGINYGPPSNLLIIGSQQFMRNLRAMQGEYSDEGRDDRPLTPRQIELHAKLQKLTLNSTEIWAREYANGPIIAPWIIKLPYLAVCNMLDTLFEEAYVPSRFFLLETVARMPYFSYISMLHLYETLGFWRRSADAKRIHFAEELNEYAHLMIMESLGGDQSWWVRFVAQHSAIVYYVVLCVLFALSPTLSYRFSELLETHAVNTYSVFLDDNEELLKELPPVNAAINYYSLGTSDPFYAEFQISSVVDGHDVRRPGENMQNMYDVFSAIRADEGDHVSAMEACLDPNVSLQSPSLERRVVTGMAATALASYFLVTTGFLDASLLDTGTVDAATAASGDLSLLELSVAGVASWARDFIQTQEEGGFAGLAEDAVEGGLLLTALEGLQKKIVEILMRIF